MYSTLINSHSRGKKKFSKTVIKKNYFKVIPGWNRRVKYYHNHARSKYLVWLSMGKIRNGIEFDEMRDSRTAFKNALNACKVNKNVERPLSIKEKFENKSMSSFWKDVQHTNNKIKRSNVIDGKNENKDIIGIFTENFLNVGTGSNKRTEDELLEMLKVKWQLEHKLHFIISHVTLKKLISKFNPGEGHDGIHAAFLKRASVKF